MVNYELLRTFVVVAEAKSHGEAARRRRVSVSAISQQMKALEVQLGVPLFERVGRRAQLTASGRSLAAELGGLMGELGSRLESLRAESHGISGRVAIGAPRAFARHFLRPRLAELLSAHPELRLVMELGVPSVLEARLLTGDLELAVMARPPESLLLTAVPMHTELFVAVGAPHYLDRVGRPRRLPALLEHPFIVFDEDLAMHRPWWQATFGRRAPADVRIRAAIGDLEEMAAMVEAGLGLAVLPDYLVAPRIAAGRLEQLRVLPQGHRARPARSTLFLAQRRQVAQTPRFVALREALLGRTRRPSMGLRR